MYNGVKIKQQNSKEFPGCTLDGNLLVLVNMATKGLRKISCKVKLSSRQGNSSNNCLRAMVSILLIEPHFDYASITWYPLINETFKKTLQKAQNKCIRFCVGLNPRYYKGKSRPKKISWLTVKKE